MGLAILVTVASLVTPQSMGGGASLTDVVMGFSYAFVAAKILSIIGLGLVFMIKDSRP
jgi:hypothetical protein